MLGSPLDPLSQWLFSNQTFGPPGDKHVIAVAFQSRYPEPGNHSFVACVGGIPREATASRGSAVCACGSEESPLPKIPERVGLAFPALQKGLVPSPAVAIRDIWTPSG